jgi:hypothetical protein
VRARNLFQTIGQAGDGEDQAVPPIKDPRAIGPYHRRHVEPPPLLATMVGRMKLQDATIASQKKTANNPKEEGGGTIPFHSLATTAGRREDNNISSPPTPKQTPKTPEIWN